MTMQTSDMKLIKCSLRGQKHKRREQPCEDSAAYLEKNGVIAVSVADGAGSAKYSEARYGSQVVSETVCKLLTGHFDELFEMANEFELRRIIEVVCKKALEEKAKSLGLDSYETMASTLLAVAVSKKRVIAVQIGDGVIGRLCGNVPEALTMPQNGEFIGTTFFITQDDSYAYLQVRRFICNNTSHLFLMTDGISDIIYNEANGSFSNGLFKMISFTEDSSGEEGLAAFVSENIVNAVQTSDDSTIAILCLDEKAATDEIKKDAEVETEEEKPKESEVISKLENHLDKAKVTKILVLPAIILIFGGLGFLFGSVFKESPMPSNPVTEITEPEKTEAETLSVELCEILNGSELGKNTKTLFGGLMPGDTVEMQPRIRNNGNMPAFVYLEIKMAGTENDQIPTNTPPFLLMNDGETGTSSSWTLLQESIADNSGTFTAVYGYNLVLEPGKSTDALFSQVSYLLSDDSSQQGEPDEAVSADNGNQVKTVSKNLLTVSATAIIADEDAEDMYKAWEKYSAS